MGIDTDFGPDFGLGPLSAEVKQRVEALSLDALVQVQLALLKADTLDELGLED